LALLVAFCLAEESGTRAWLMGNDKSHSPLLHKAAFFRGADLPLLRRKQDDLVASLAIGTYSI
jgi:hypothetical protein